MTFRASQVSLHRSEYMRLTISHPPQDCRSLKLAIHVATPLDTVRDIRWRRCIPVIHICHVRHPLKQTYNIQQSRTARITSQLKESAKGYQAR